LFRLLIWATGQVEIIYAHVYSHRYELNVGARKIKINVSDDQYVLYNSNSTTQIHTYLHENYDLKIVLFII